MGWWSENAGPAAQTGVDYTAFCRCVVIILILDRADIAKWSKVTRPIVPIR
ncbi:MAG: hypothetical protein ACI9OJ_003423 [Myxococcota bacterium]|jgi:hypothetical protein